MRVSFTPALGQTTVVPVADDAEEVQLLFRASFDSEEDRAHAKQERIRVEVWSDIPVEGRAPGEWGALAFEHSSEDASRGSDTFSLLPRSDVPSQGEAAAKTHGALHLKLTARLPYVRAQFSYTYRLVFPSGEIRWLGEYGRNGSLVLERRDPRFNLRKGWTTENEGLHLWHAETPADDVEVAELSRDFDWFCWAVGGEGRILPHALGDNPVNSSTLFLTPRPKTDSIICPSSVILGGSPGSSISISSAGVVQYSSPHPSSLRIWTSPASHRATEEALASSSGIGIRLVRFDLASGQTIFASAAGAQPLYVSIIPFSPIAATTEVVLPIGTLYDLLPEANRKRACVFSHASRACRWLSLSSEESSEKAQITFVVDKYTGGQFVVAPVSRLDDARSGQAWEAAVVTPHSFVCISPEPVHRLPTPPPSPPIYRATKASPPPVRPEHVKKVSFSEPVESVIEDSEENTEEESPMRSVPLTVARVYRQTPVQSVFKRYLDVVLQASFWFFRNILWFIFGFMRVFGPRVHPSESRAGEDEADGSDERPVLEEEPSVADDYQEDEPSLVDDSHGEKGDKGANISPSPSSVAEVDTPLISPRPSTDHIINLEDRADDELPSSILQNPLPVLIADVPGGDTKFIIGPARSLDQLRVELSGKPAQLVLDVVPGSDHLSLATIDGGQHGGRLVVSVSVEH